MTFPFLDLFRWDGRISRKTYALVGLTAFAFKYPIDYFIATRFRHAVGLFNYWVPLGKVARLTYLSEAEYRFLAAMLLVAMPFIWVGLALTVRRLRDAGQPVWLVVFFFFPYLNLLFFLALCLLPPCQLACNNEAAPWPVVRPLDGIIPHSPLGSAVLSVILTTAIGLMFVLFGTVILGSYGWSLFVALPFCLGLFAVLLHSYHGPREFWTCFNVSLLPVGLLGLLLLVVAVEGLVCILMAAPLALGLATLGGSLGYSG